jgi:hypothetical protein
MSAGQITSMTFPLLSASGLTISECRCRCDGVAGLSVLITRLLLDITQPLSTRGPRFEGFTKFRDLDATGRATVLSTLCAIRQLSP